MKEMDSSQRALRRVDAVASHLTPRPAQHRSLARGEPCLQHGVTNHDATYYALQPQYTAAYGGTDRMFGAPLFANWSQTESCRPSFYHRPSSIAELRDIVCKAATRGERVKVVGSGHSPGSILLTPRSGISHMISLDNMRQIYDAEMFEDGSGGVVRMDGGVRLYELNRELPKRFGLALSSLGSICEQSIAGVLSTATHGTGIKFGIIARSVRSLKIMLANGEVVDVSPNTNRDLFDACRCGLGALGIIVEVSLVCEKAFHLHAKQWQISFEQGLSAMNEELHKHDHFRMWYIPHADRMVMWSANRSSLPILPDRAASTLRDTIIGFYGFEAALLVTRYIPQLLPLVNQAMGKVVFAKPRERIDVSHRIFNFDCLFRQYVNEWAIPVERTADALRALRQAIAENRIPAHLPIEIRFVGEDDIWLSPAYKRNVCYIGIIMYRPFGLTVPYKNYFFIYEDIMTSLGGRPHWAKCYWQDSSFFEKRLEKFEDFRRIRKELDPSGVFGNDFLDRVLGPVS